MNGKPFGFGFEYSDESNLVYEGFLFEGKKVCIGKEWNDDEITIAWYMKEVIVMMNDGVMVNHMI